MVERITVKKKKNKHNSIGKEKFYKVKKKSQMNVYYDFECLDRGCL